MYMGRYGRRPLVETIAPCPDWEMGSLGEPEPRRSLGRIRWAAAWKLGERLVWHLAPRELAEGVGFEPTNDLRRCRFSRPVR